jgi:predicted site-specific integrase-resolvase
MRTKGNRFRIGFAYAECVGYARVSSSKQRASLNTQRENILKAYPNIEIVQDVGSGFNFKRKGFVALLERAMSGVAIELVVSDRDRLSRVGYEFVEATFKQFGGSVVSLNNEIKADGFDTDLLVGFITSFCNSYYGKRAARNKRSKSKDKALSNK